MDTRINSRHRMASNLLFILIFSLPILRYYNVFGTNLGMESLLIVVILVLMIFLALFAPVRHAEHNELIYSKKWFALFGIWALIVTSYYELFTDINISNVNSSYTIMTFVRFFIVVFAIYFLIKGYLDTKDTAHIYSVFVMLVLSIYVIQWIIYLTGRKFDFGIPFLQFTNSYRHLDAQYFGMNSTPTSLFSERAHLSQYLVPYIALCLYGKNFIKAKRLTKAILVSIIVLSTVSGNGLVIVFLEWVLYFLKFGIRKRGYRVFASILGIILIFSVFLLLKNIPSFQAMLSRLFIDNTGSIYTSTKADYRIYRGFDLFTKLPVPTKLFGVGFNHMQTFALENGIRSNYDKSWLVYEYFATIFTVLLYFGLVGLFFFLKSVFALYRAKSYTAKGLIIIVIALWFSSSIFMDGTHLMYIALIVTAIQNDNQCYQIKTEKCR